MLEVLRSTRQLSEVDRRDVAGRLVVSTGPDTCVVQAMETPFKHMFGTSTSDCGSTKFCCNLESWLIICIALLP